MLSTGLLSIAFLLAGSAVSIVAARHALTRPTIKGYHCFAFFMLALTVWMLGYALEFAAVDQDWMLFWAKVQYLGIPFVTPLLMLYLLQHSDVNWLRPWMERSVLVVPILTVLIIWIRPTLNWASAEILTSNFLTFYSFEYGPWFYVHVTVSYICQIISLFLLVRIVTRSPTLTRNQGRLLLLGLLIPFFGNILYIFGVDLLGGIDWTPFAIAMFGVATAWVIFDFRWYDLTPIASATALESLPDSVFLLDINNRIRTCNTVARQMFGLENEPLSQIDLEDLLPPDWCLAISEVAVSDLRTTDVISESGSRYYELRLAPVYDRRNRLQGRLIVIRDITTRTKAQISLAQRGEELSARVSERTAELRAANEQLVQSAKLKDEFLAGVSHELRTPLNAVIGTAEAMRESVYGNVTDKQNLALQRIEQSASHLLSLINDILDVSKIQSGQFKIHVGSASVKDICESALNVVRPMAQRKQIDIHSEYNIVNPIIEVDERRIFQVLLNLLSNAVKFTPENGKVTLDAYDSKHTRQTLFVVSDTGIGISEEDQSRLFKPFVQVDGSLARRYEGTGLGLSLAQSLTELHGGTITVQSTPNEGSTFCVTIPWDLPEGEAIVRDLRLEELSR